MLKKIATFTINVGTTSVIGHTGSAKYKRLHNCVFLGTAVRHLDRVVSRHIRSVINQRSDIKMEKVYWKSYDLHIRKRMGI